MKSFNMSPVLLVLMFMVFAFAGPVPSFNVNALGNLTSDSINFDVSADEVAGRSRRGIAYNKVEYVNLFNQDKRHTTWCYNWDSRPYRDTPVEFIPMLHSVRDEHISRWQEDAMKAINANLNAPSHLLGFNEPDNCRPDTGGSCISVDAAVAGWKKYIQPLKSAKAQVFLGSPAVTNGADTLTSGLGWLRSFMEKCNGCDIDFINIHWYDSSPNVPYFKAHIEAARELAQGRPIWITEFKPQGSNSQIKTFLDEVMPWLDASTDVHRYAYFMATTGDEFLIDQQGSGLSELGMTYNLA